MKQFSIQLAAAFILALPLSAAAAEDPAEFRFAKIIADDMVLQREKPIKIWGWAASGSKVSVTLTQDSKVGEAAVVGAVEAGTRKAPPGEDSGDDYSVKMRYIERNPPVLETRTLEAKADDTGRWSVQFPPARASFQPTWLIARSGEKTIAAQNILIGEVWLCAGQSNMGWSNFNRKGREAASADFPGLRYVAWHDSWYRPVDDVRNNIRWQECSPESAQKFSAVPYLYGMFLHRYLKVPVGIINVARGGTTGQAWCLREELDNIDHVTVKSILANYDAETAKWDDSAQVEAIMADWQAAVDLAEADHKRRTDLAAAEGKEPPRKRLPKRPGDARSGWSPPAGLFNATVIPIRHLGIRGVLYYQGENNNFMQWTRYEHTFPKVPLSFRKAFGDEDLPFGCISQPGWGTFGLDPEIATIAEGYAIVRDIQRRALKEDSHAGMIATYPTGNSYIHPAEKLPVAEYASLWALAKVYGQPVVHRAGEYQHMRVDGDKLRLFFDSDPVVFDRWKHIENNASWQVLPQPREGNAERLGFIIAGEDRRWFPARAQEKRVDGEWCIELSSDLVSNPVAARYGWANWPTGNMVGRERLPLPTFRTDDWPIPEGVSYSDEAKKVASENLDALKKKAAIQAFDRKTRQALIDLRKFEDELHRGDLQGMLAAKIGRLEGTLEELQESNRWLAGAISKEAPDLAEKIETIRAEIEALKAASAEVGK